MGEVPGRSGGIQRIVETSYYPLLTKDETPFSVFWYDRYPEIMRPNSQQAASSSVPAPFGTPVAPPADGE